MPQSLGLMWDSTLLRNVSIYQLTSLIIPERLQFTVIILAYIYCIAGLADLHYSYYCRMKFNLISSGSSVMFPESLIDLCQSGVAAIAR
jgi:hypothetical protein